MQAKLWTLLGRKAGDNAQVLTLAGLLDAEVTQKRIRARAWEIVPHLMLGPTLLGIDRAASSPLAPPWPDMVISAGRRNEPVARWIRAQSGGATRLVHIGRPWAPPDTYDLIVTTPQYFLTDGGNVLVNPLPLHAITPEAVQAAAARLAPQLASLPQPYTTVLVGGDSGPFVLTPAKGRALARGLNRLLQETGGSALITGSPRTPPGVMQALRDTLQVPAHIHDWQARDPSADNPYLGFLGLAARFVVTGESMSMLAEAGSLGRPLYIFDPGDPPGTFWQHRHNLGHKPISHALAMRLAPRRMRRNVARIQQALVDDGRARWLPEAPALVRAGETWVTQAQTDPQADARRAAARARALLPYG